MDREGSIGRGVDGGARKRWAAWGSARGRGGGERRAEEKEFMFWESFGGWLGSSRGGLLDAILAESRRRLGLGAERGRSESSSMVVSPCPGSVFPSSRSMEAWMSEEVNVSIESSAFTALLAGVTNRDAEGVGAWRSCVATGP